MGDTNNKNYMGYKSFNQYIAFKGREYYTLEDIDYVLNTTSYEAKDFPIEFYHYGMGAIQRALELRRLTYNVDKIKEKYGGSESRHYKAIEHKLDVNYIKNDPVEIKVTYVSPKTVSIEVYIDTPNDMIETITYRKMGHFTDKYFERLALMMTTNFEEWTGDKTKLNNNGLRIIADAIWFKSRVESFYHPKGSEEYKNNIYETIERFVEAYKTECTKLGNDFNQEYVNKIWEIQTNLKESR